MDTWPTHIHFFNAYTRISLELPIGFEEQYEDTERRVVVYAADSDEDDDDSDVTGGGAVGARVLTHAFGVEGDVDALIAAADGSAAVPGRHVEFRERGAADGRPAVRQLLRYHEPEFGAEMMQHETWVQSGNVVFSVVFAVPADRSGEYRPAWEHLSHTLRLVLPEEDQPGGEDPEVILAETGRSWARSEMGFSVLVPGGWEITRPEEHLVRLFGPEHPEHDDYRPTFSVSVGTPDGFGDEWFAQFCDDALRRLQDAYDEFALDRTERFSLSSLVEVNATWYRWRPSPAFRSAQLQALIPVGSYRMFLINAATIEPLAAHYQPVFDQILRSLRVL